MTQYALLLNDMRHPHVEDLTVVAVADSPEPLVALHNEHHEPWKDGRWNKAYRKDSPLEWFNEASPEPNSYWGGVYDFPDTATLPPVGTLD